MPVPEFWVFSMPMGTCIWQGSALMTQGRFDTPPVAFITPACCTSWKSHSLTVAGSLVVPTIASHLPHDLT